MLLAATASASDFPTEGTLYGALDGNFIRYSCVPPTSEGLRCFFVQISAIRRGGPDALKKDLARLEKEYSAIKDGMAQDACSVSQIMTPEQQIEAIHRNFNRSVGKQEASDIIAFHKAFEAICANPTKESIAHVARLQNDKETRTCSIQMQSFNQLFRKSENKWVYSSGVLTECGAINIATFFKGTTRLDDHWSYSSERIVTDKSAKLGGVLQCSVLDEREFNFEWTKETYFKGCDYLTMD